MATSFKWLKGERLENPVTIVDSPMGYGKTTYMLDYVSRNKDQPYLIATPYLSEVDRWEQHIDHLEQPSTEDSPAKLAHLKELLARNTSIITSHALFTLLDEKCLKLIRDKGYTLIIDETLNCIETVPIHSDDIDMLERSGVLSISDDTTYECLEWIDHSYEGNIASGIKKWIEAKEVIRSSDAYFHIMRSDKIKSFKNAYILTYMFDSSIMAAYFRLNGVVIPYKKYSIRGGKRVDYYDPMGCEYKDFIDLVNTDKTDIRRLKRLEKYSLSKSFYDNPPKDAFSKISNATRSYFDGFDTDKNLNMFTVFKKYEPDIATHRFKKIETDEKGNKRNTCFVALNAKASNDYAHKTRLAYLVNRFMNPLIVQLLKKHGSSIDDEKYALSELIQWIYRSAIRNKEPITVFIPSNRMRELLISWVN